LRRFFVWNCVWNNSSYCDSLNSSKVVFRVIFNSCMFVVT